LINSSVGGTPIEAWTSMDVQKDLPQVKPIFDQWAKRQAGWDPAKAAAQNEKQTADYKETAKKAKADGKPAPKTPQKQVEPRLDSHYPANLFNGKIAPLIPFAIRGAIWYQGENNAGSVISSAYGLQLSTLIKDWRQRWAEGDFPFGWVQLPNFKKPQVEPVEDTGWVHVREGMLKTLS